MDRSWEVEKFGNLYPFTIRPRSDHPALRSYLIILDIICFEREDMVIIFDWCRTNVRGAFLPAYSHIDPIFRFEKEEDCLLFKLRWG
jgi:hypothetical protein